jgi:F-box and WD-40 domain protein 1/11
MLQDLTVIDPMECLPPELIIHILSFLDSKSVLNAGLVSKSWLEAASSRHVWKDVFLREYAKRAPQPSTHSSTTQAAGLGRVRPDQDWKKMFLVRRALDMRWIEGKAAAIYLVGHKDSVYCVQFDE